MEIKDFPWAPHGGPPGTPAVKTTGPIVAEYPTVTRVPPTVLKTKLEAYFDLIGLKPHLTKSWLIKNFATNPTASMVFLGNPKLVVTKEKPGEYIVADILNKDIPGYSAVSEKAPGVAGVNWAEKFDKYNQHLRAIYPLGQKYVFQKAAGISFFNKTTAGICSEGVGEHVAFNCHFPTWSNSAYHELLHTVEGESLTAENATREGFTEFFALQFARHAGYAAYPVYPPYKKVYDNVMKMAQAVKDVKLLAKAYYTDNADSLKQLVPRSRTRSPSRRSSRSSSSTLSRSSTWSSG